jgi:hypothetical protein
MGPEAGLSPHGVRDGGPSVQVHDHLALSARAPTSGRFTSPPDVAPDRQGLSLSRRECTAQRQVCQLILQHGIAGVAETPRTICLRIVRGRGRMAGASGTVQPSSKSVRQDGVRAERARQPLPDRESRGRESEAFSGDSGPFVTFPGERTGRNEHPASRSRTRKPHDKLRI